MADEKKAGEVVDPADATKHGYWGYTPVEKDRREFSVAVQGPIAEEAAQGGAASKASGAGTVEKDAAAEKQAVKPRAAKETTR